MILSWSDVNSFFKYDSHSYFRRSWRWRKSNKSHSLARKASLIASMWFSMVLGTSRVSRWGGPHGAIRMVVVLCQVSNPCSATCRECKLAWLHNQEEGRWEIVVGQLKVVGYQVPRTSTPTALHRISADGIRIQISQPIAHHFTWIFISKSKQP